jgi:hypothetical protein
MNTFKKKSLHAAVLAGLGALGVAGTANAVHINPDGLGQILIYPYYTVRNGNVTAMSVVNTTSLTKIVKVRFLEGKNSREVLDFNLFLSPQDVWTGVILPTATGAKIETGDNSCVTPSDLFGNAAGTIRTDGTYATNEFKNYTYTVAPADSTVYTSNDRTREGYIEVIEMGILNVPATAAFAKHAPIGAATAGIPNNCAALDAFDSTLGVVGTAFPVGLIPPGGGLAGRGSLINAANGTNYAFDVTAIDGWTTAVEYAPAGSLQPSITSTGAGTSTVANIFVTASPLTTGTAIVPGAAAFPAQGAPTAGVATLTFGTTLDAMSAILMRNTVINEFITDASTISKTDWVVTMPTKRGALSGAAAARPFANLFNGTTGACDPYTIGMWNREEGTLTAPAGVILPSPIPPGVTAAGQNLCWEANVIEFGTTGLLASNNNVRLLNGFDTFASTTATTTGAAFATLSRRVLQGPNGWAFLGFGATFVLNTVPAIVAGPQPTQSIASTTSSLNGVVDAAPNVPRIAYGMPVIGTAFHNFTNSGVASAYGGVVPHKFTRAIR